MTELKTVSTCWAVKRKLPGHEDYHEAFRLYSPEAVGEIVRVLLTHDPKGSNPLLIEMGYDSTCSG